MSVEEKVIDIVSEKLDIARDKVSAEKSFLDDLNADSLDLVEVVMAIEDEFDIKVPDSDYEKLRTVGDAVNYIEEKS